MFVSRITFALPSKNAFPMLGSEGIPLGFSESFREMQFILIPSGRSLSRSRGSTYANLKTKFKARVFSLWLIVVLLFTIGCSISNDKLIEQYNAFAIRSAKANLWNEASLRWQRIIEIDPKNAKAHNNLAVAYEAMERFDEALVEYKQAIELEPGNEDYQRNFFNCQKNKGRSWHTERNGERK